MPEVIRKVVINRAQRISLLEGNIRKSRSYKPVKMAGQEAILAMIVVAGKSFAGPR